MTEPRAVVVQLPGIEPVRVELTPSERLELHSVGVAARTDPQTGQPPRFTVALEWCES